MEKKDLSVTGAQTAREMYMNILLGDYLGML